jgi:acetyl-CoA acetyltransferase
MTTEYTGWRRDKEGLGIWDGQGKVAIVGWGQSDVDRRWDGVSMDKTYGAYGMKAIQQALDDAGVKPEDVDGMFVCPETGAGATGGASADWGPSRPYFEPPYDSEWGLSRLNAKWIIDNMPGFTNVQFAPDNVPAIGEQMGMVSQAVADGKCKTALLVYGMNNFEGRYRHGGDNASDFAPGPRQWNAPWSSGDGLQLTGAITIQQYCERYGVQWDELMAPVIINEHRNGLMHDWGFYSLHGASGLTFEDYVNARPVLWPCRIWDCDRPVNAVGAFLFTTPDRAADMKQKPVYVLNHNGGQGGSVRSSQETLDESEAARAQVARMAYEGSGLHANEVDIFNPYDGYSFFMPLTLEGFGWHGVGKGDSKDFFNGDISVEGPHPFTSGGGNLGVGRTRTAMYIDSIEQLRGTAGKRQVNIKAETAICAFAPARSAAYMCLSSVKP